MQKQVLNSLELEKEENDSSKRFSEWGFDYSKIDNEELEKIEKVITYTGGNYEDGPQDVIDKIITKRGKI